ncbi:hypothetical protein AB7M23_004428 [Pseudomonas sp. HLS-6 TE3448]
MMMQVPGVAHVTDATAASSLTDTARGAYARSV